MKCIQEGLVAFLKHLWDYLLQPRVKMKSLWILGEKQQETGKFLHAEKGMEEKV